MPGIRSGETNSRQVLRPDPQSQSSRAELRSSGRALQHESDLRQETSLVGTSNPQARDPVFERFSTVTGPPPASRQRAGLAHSSVHAPGLGFQPDSASLAMRPPQRVLTPFRAGENSLFAASRRVEDAGQGDSQSQGVTLKEGQVPVYKPIGHAYPPQNLAMSSTGDMQGNSRTGTYRVSATPLPAPCLLDCSPPKEGQGWYHAPYTVVDALSTERSPRTTSVEYVWEPKFDGGIAGSEC